MSRFSVLRRSIGQAGTIRMRLTLWYVLLLALILVAFSALLFLLLDRSLNNQIDNDLHSAAEQAQEAVRLRNGQLSVRSDEAESGLSALAERDLLARVISLDGKIIESDGPFKSLPVPAMSLQVTERGDSHFDTAQVPGTIESVRLYTVPFRDHGITYGFVQVGESIKSAQGTLGKLLLLMAFTIPATLIVSTIGGLFLANRALSPIDRITRAAQRISAEDLEQRLDLTLPDDEVGRLARTFDDMLARLEEAFQRQRQFTADASHELRTPLAIMKGGIGVTLNRPRTVDEYQDVLLGLEEEVDRLTRMVEDLLLLARSDSGQSLVRLETFDLADLLPVLLDRVHTMADAKMIAIVFNNPETLPVRGDPDKLVRIFLNLLDNAIKYTPCGGRVEIWAHHEEQQGQLWIVVEVSDNGPGIPPEQLAHIFERFYRADTSRSRANGGAGLGLAIARLLTEAHGGHIAVRSLPEHGSVFRVFLPAAAMGNGQGKIELEVISGDSETHGA